MYKGTFQFDRAQQLASTHKAHGKTRRTISIKDPLTLSKPCIKGYRQCPYNNGNGACLYGADQCTKKEIK
jgi:hypothetical protein